MPCLDLKLAAPGSNASSAAIAERLTGRTAEVLAKKREPTSVTVEHLRADRWFPGGSPLAVRKGVGVIFLGEMTPTPFPVPGVTTA